MAAPQSYDVDAVAEHIAPGRKMDAQLLAEQGAVYKEMLGFVPPRISTRFKISGPLEQKVVALQEELRKQAMYPDCMDQKTVQLMLFGMLLMDMNDAVQIHGIAARRAGASWEEMQAVINLCFLFRGLSAANKGAEILANIADREMREAGKA